MGEQHKVTEITYSDIEKIGTCVDIYSRGGGADKIENMTTHPCRGKNKWLSLFSAVVASSVPRSEWMKRGVVFKQDRF